MLQFKRKNKLKAYLSSIRANKSIAFVPTMGALHQGHISLISEAKKNNDIVICSIFVNPTQFNNPNDLKSYPKTIEKDLINLATTGCDMVFLPINEEMYDEKPAEINLKPYNNITNVLEALYRPGHYNGVIDVVNRFFSIIEPNQVYFGQKDYQQCLVIKKLIALQHPKINFNMCNSIRETDGLAMSSRNVKLNITERNIAPILYKSLQYIEHNWPANPNQLKQEAINKFIKSNPGIAVEYLDICDPETLQKLTVPQPKAVALIAAKIGSTRLIDNVIIGF